MAKVNYTKVEGAFENALKKLFIENLSELATIANVIQDPEANLSNKAISNLITRFHRELKKLKKHDSKLFAKLNLTPEEEARFALPADQYIQRDWMRLRTLKERIDELKHELYGEESINVEYEKQVAKERRRHVNKRFNIRDGWLPLH